MKKLFIWYVPGYHESVMGIQCSYPDYSTGTYYCTNAAIKTLFKNLFSRKKYPTNLRHTKLSVIMRDPIPEIVYAGEVLMGIPKKMVRRIRNQMA